MNRLIVITGPPASGKTTLARALAPELGLPLLSKDDFKERLFEPPPPGLDARAWSRRLSDLAWDELFAEAAKLDAALIEGNLPPERGAHVLALHPDPIELFCRVPEAVLIERLSSRGERHAAHDDTSLIEEVKAGTVRGLQPLRLDHLIEVSTHGPTDIPGLIEALG